MLAFMKDRLDVLIQALAFLTQHLVNKLSSFTTSISGPEHSINRQARGQWHDLTINATQCIHRIEELSEGL